MSRLRTSRGRPLNAPATLSALGQKQTFTVQNGMSALPPKVDMCSATRDVCFVPLADICSANFGSPARREGALARVPETDEQLGDSWKGGSISPKSSSEVMSARRQDGGVDVNQSSNVKVYSSSYPFGVSGVQTGEGEIVMDHTDPAFHGVVVALTIIIVVCGLIVVTNFFITLSR